ncbi:NineTeen Complex (NTC) component [Cryptotrichosporon argae]
MSRNSEKAQSMLYRFRETQAAELGLANRVKGERRPRMASSVTNLRECERWRGDILRDISRKVSKIQDATLTDFEIRDLNDEINALMREKRHWETQIVALGGANYKRAQGVMTDDGGREVPGTRGYKYFGRARELPGVKEMFTRGAQAATEESARNASFQMFRNQGAEYYGDLDEVDAGLIREEDELARQEWDAAARKAAAQLGLPDSAAPPFPQHEPAPFPLPLEPAAPTDDDAATGTKRKSPPPEPAPAPAPETADPVAAPAAPTAPPSRKRGKANNRKTKAPPPPPPGAPAPPTAAPAPPAPTSRQTAEQAALAASFMSVFDPASLRAPDALDKDAMGKILLDVRKRALLEEYGV